MHSAVQKIWACFPYTNLICGCCGAIKGFIAANGMLTTFWLEMFVVIAGVLWLECRKMKTDDWCRKMFLTFSYQLWHGKL